jgi:hypothetical protein
LGNVDQTVLLAAAVITGLALGGLVVGLLAFSRVRALSGDSNGHRPGARLHRHAAAAPAWVETNSRDVAILKDSFEAASIEARTHFKRMGIVRYNAFEGVAGQQSYSLAILDENKTGS